MCDVFPMQRLSDDLADLVLHHDGLSLLDDEPPGPDVDLVLEVFEGVVARRELYVRDCRSLAASQEKERRRVTDKRRQTPSS